MTVKWLYDPSGKYAGNQARNIMRLKPKSALRILAFVHKPDNVTSIIRFVDASHPNEEDSFVFMSLTSSN
ncbi:conserved hypothetical protein [Ricinus communis]|uniref:Uncharacterized protein n=1 Tax=Ricinus communis TaxID=3988 RepID=B9SCK7_RICCO|nr:conserved hypothetical protein [Ricinus communis]